MLHAEAKQHSDFDKRLAEEERWIRQGIKARRTRNEGRVRALEAMRSERTQRRELLGKVSFDVNEAQKSGKLVINAEHITHGFDHQNIIKDFSIRIMRGDRIGLIGPNGIGKSTLLNILLGELKPQQGVVTHGTKLQIAYFDQLRQSLDMEKTVFDNVAQGSDYVEINGKKRHMMSYLNDFLFAPQRVMSPVKALSGGECNRLVLARLFSQPSNLLVLDEPTNDLDIETLELLEELLGNYEGTLLIVSHDRAFLDNVVTSTLVFEGSGKIQEYIGGYNDWLQQAKKNVKQDAVKNFNKENLVQEKQIDKKKLSYKEQQELKDLPKKLEKLEAEQSKVQELVATADFYQQMPDKISTTLARLKQLEDELLLAYERWEVLEQISQKK